MRENIPDMEGNGPITLENGVLETSPLLHNSSIGQVSPSPTTAASVSDTEPAKPNETSRNDGVGAVLSLLMIGLPRQSIKHFTAR